MYLQKKAELFKDVICNIKCRDEFNDIIDLEEGMRTAYQWLSETIQYKSMVYIVGNGGSAAVASHAQIDFLNVAKIRAQVLHEPSVLTCMSNDYGYENAYSLILDVMLKPHDMLIAISSSGQSKNIFKAAELVKSRGGKVVTLTGFQPDNLLSYVGHINYWLDSCDYGFVEVGHQFLLHNLSDRFANIQDINISNG